MDTEAIRKLLESQGYEVTITPNGGLLDITIRFIEYAESVKTSKSKAPKAMLEIAERLKKKKPYKPHNYDDDYVNPKKT